jgi:hypothetical protein
MYDTTSAELVKAKRRLREDDGSEGEVLLLQAQLSAMGCDLADCGEFADQTEPGDVSRIMP